MDGAHNTKAPRPSSRSIAASMISSRIGKPSTTSKATHQRSTSGVPLPSSMAGLKSSIASVRDTGHRSEGASLPARSLAMTKSSPLVAKSTTRTHGRNSTPSTLSSPTIGKRMSEEAAGTAGKQVGDGKGVQTRQMATRLSTGTQRQLNDPASATSARAIQTRPSLIKSLEEKKSKVPNPASDLRSNIRGSAVAKSPRTCTIGPPLVMATKGTPRSGKNGFGSASTTAAMPTPSRISSRIPLPDHHRRSLAPSAGTPVVVKGANLADSVHKQALGKSLFVKPTRKMSLLGDRELSVAPPLRSANRGARQQYQPNLLLDNLVIGESTNRSTRPLIPPVEEMAARSLAADSGTSAASDGEDKYVGTTTLPVDGGVDQVAAATDQTSAREFFDSEIDEIDAFGGKAARVDDLASPSSNIEASLMNDIQHYRTELDKLKQERKELATRLQESVQQNAHAEAERKKVKAAKLFMDVTTACQVELDRLQQERKNRACRAAVLSESMQMALIGQSLKGTAVGGI
ncbi:hypothetical protein QFC22_002018 [Naganishia vaughanmartiniae]|uniref:Uncharacterized protein n=1 Tax=Naganishia vaughanmartiniae TaxID=1424756 RepID=A0ACC2XEX7_9TREE|nr:hypothetical protein QFC22_002018 [Naganishia vaughanmartiniae]